MRAAGKGDKAGHDPGAFAGPPARGVGVGVAIGGGRMAGIRAVQGAAG